MLRLEKVSYRYPGTGRNALSAIDLEIADGEAVGVVGASESGKTTLALVCSGLAPASVGGKLDGRVYVDDQDTAGRPIHELASLVGICFQNPTNQLSQVADTVFEEVAFGALNLGFDRLDVIVRTSEALDALGIYALAERDPRRLSGGQMQLVALAGLLAMRPRHLVLDEPTAQLDPDGKRLVINALAGLASSGTGLLVAEHDTDLLASLCTRVIALDAGLVALEGPTEVVFGSARLAELGVGVPERTRLSQKLSAAGLSVELPA